MTIHYRDTDGVTIGENASSELVDVATQIKKLRETASVASREHSRQIDAINNDPALSDHGRKEKVAELEAARRAQRKALIAQEKEIINNKISALERRLDGYAGYSEANIMAFRDAQDRAEAIKDGDRAATVMARALRTNDRTLAHALFRRAVENRWQEARRAFAAENPTVASLASDVARLQQLRDESFNRAVAYM